MMMRGVSIMKEVRQGTYTYKEDSNVFNFVTDLSVSEKLTFVNSIVDIVVDEDNYNSIIKDLMCCRRIEDFALQSVIWSTLKPTSPKRILSILHRSVWII